MSSQKWRYINSCIIIIIIIIIIISETVTLVYHLIHLSPNSAFHQKNQNYQSGISFSVESAIHNWINHYLVNNEIIGLPNILISAGWWFMWWGKARANFWTTRAWQCGTSFLSTRKQQNMKHDIRSWVVNESDSLTTRQ